MKVKPGVTTARLKVEMWKGLDVFEQVYLERIEPVITSTDEGEHMAGSKHYVDLAVDLRSRNLSPKTADDILMECRRRLPKGFQIILEGDHFHLEWDP